jgi:hypothetical protein
MSLRKNLLIVAPNRLDAFTATGVLADMLRAEPTIEVEIICRDSDRAYFENAPGRLSFLTYSQAVPPRFQLMLKTLGRTWHRIVSLTPLRLPFLLWARHRHSFRFHSGTYALPSLFRPERATPPHIWTPEKIHVALPETLAPSWLGAWQMGWSRLKTPILWFWQAPHVASRAAFRIICPRVK